MTVTGIKLLSKGSLSALSEGAAKAKGFDRAAPICLWGNR